MPPYFPHPVAFLGGLGTTEILIILAVALIVLGPGKLPEVARSIGKGLRELRRATDEVRDTVYGEVSNVKDEIAAVRKDVVEQVTTATKGEAERSPPSPPAPAAEPVPVARPDGEPQPPEGTSD